MRISSETRGWSQESDIPRTARVANVFCSGVSLLPTRPANHLSDIFATGLSLCKLSSRRSTPPEPSLALYGIIVIPKLSEPLPESSIMWVTALLRGELAEPSLAAAL